MSSPLEQTLTPQHKRKDPLLMTFWRPFCLTQMWVW